MSNPLEKYLTEKNAGAGRKFLKGMDEVVTHSPFERAVKGAVKGEERAENVGRAAGHAAKVGLPLGIGAMIGRHGEKKRHEKEKEASFGSMLQRAKEPAFNAAVGGATMGGLTAGAAAVSFGAKKLYDAITKRRDFRTMLEHNPDLQEALDRDPKFFNQAYSSLRSVNSQFASEPLIAGNYMRQMMESPLSAGGKLELALQGAAHHHSPVLDATMRGVQSGLGKQTDPHADLENQVRGLSLQRKQHELSQPPQMDPHAGLEQEVRGLKLQRDKERFNAPPKAGPGF